MLAGLQSTTDCVWRRFVRFSARCANRQRALERGRRSGWRAGGDGARYRAFDPGTVAIVASHRRVSSDEAVGGATLAFRASNTPQVPPAHFETTSTSRSTSSPPALASAGPECCSTPREGKLSGGYGAWDMGVISVRPEAAARLGIGPGFVTQLRFALEFWDHLLVGMGFGAYLPADERPFSESVVDCSSYDGATFGCGTDPHPQDSRRSVGGGFLTAEAGYQIRYRTSHRSFVGARREPRVFTFDAALTRSVGCEGCRSEKLSADLSGGYLAPFVKMTIGSGRQLRAGGALSVVLPDRATNR